MDIYCPKCGIFESNNEVIKCGRCGIDMKEFIQTQHVQFTPTERTFHAVIDDIQPYRSMVDGTMIMSRSKHKAHLKQHGMIEIGNEKMPEKKEQKYDSDAVKREIARQLYR